MTVHEQTIAPTALDPATAIGAIALTVADLERSVAYYTGPIGLALLHRAAGEAVLGVGAQPLLLLREQPGAAPWPRGGRSYTGLYHFAILVPTRRDLGRWLHHWIELGLPLPGQGDHLVSEALYLEDPDGHGVEIYRDRPRAEWQWDGGQVRMGTGPVDIRALLTDAIESGEPWAGMDEETILGHVHLQVGDIPQAARFYHDILGFDIVASMASSALFVSAGGYHHHLGMNVWHSQGATPAPDSSVNLRFFTVALPTEEARAAVVARLEAAGVERREVGNVVVLHDPWQNAIILHVGPLANAETAATLLRASR